MDGTLRRLLALLEEGPVDVRCASAILLGVVGGGDPRVAAALRARLSDENPLLRRYAAEGLGKLRAKSAIPDLLGLVARGGEEGLAAAEAVASMGDRGVRALREAMSAVAPGVRKLIAGAVAASEGAGEAGLESLLDPDPNVVATSLERLESSLERAGPAERREAPARLLRFVERRDVRENPRAVAAALGLLERVAEPSLAARLWAFASRGLPPAVRAAALRAVAALPPPREAKRIGMLFDALESGDVNLTVPALRVLERIDFPKGSESRLLPLLEVTDPRVRTFAFRGLRGLDAPAVGRAVAQHLDHPDPEVRREAEATAVALRSGRVELLRGLDRSRDPAEAARWSAVLLQAPGPPDPDTAKAITSRALRWIERGDYRAADALHLLRRARGDEAFDLLLARARALRRASKWKEALAFHRAVERDRRFGPEDRFDLAVVELQLGEADPAPDRRAGDPALHRFGALLSRDGFPLLERLRREKSLKPRQLYYVGFHFSEFPGNPERGFGGEVLRLLAARAPRTPEGRAAKNKLRREALA